jgi:hypothetical protein
MGVGISGQEVPSGPDSNTCSHHAQLGYARTSENDALGRVYHEETWSHRAPLGGFHHYRGCIGLLIIARMLSINLWRPATCREARSAGRLAAESGRD